MTRVLLDTNILVSVILDSHGVSGQVYIKAVEPPYQILICEQTLEELRRVFNRKFPNKIPMLERFIATMIPAVEVIPVPPDVHADEYEIRDADDRPILRAAIKAEVDILVTGDKDFLESSIVNPQILTAAQFLNV